MSINQSHNKDATNFLRLGRSIRDDYVNGRLKLMEFLLIVWLQLEANPHNGTLKVSLEGLVQDFKSEFSKSYINRILIQLKKKKYLFFESRQGQSGSFFVYLNNYPLSNKRFTNIERMFLSESSLQGEELEIAKAKAELIDGWQKFQDDIEANLKGDFQYPDSTSRSANNDNQNHNETKNQKSLQVREKQTNLIQNESEYEIEKERCEEIAELLCEESPAFVLSACAKYGIDVVEEAYETTINKNPNYVENPGAFFNSMVTKLGKEKLERELDAPI